ncbi:MAG: hypothetical protein AB7T07_03990 [Steroidobacteraceae bacterium]
MSMSRWYLCHSRRAAARVRDFLVVVALLSPPFVLGQAADAGADKTVEASQDEAPTVAARWQSYDLRFHYFGFTTYYSCTGLEDRLKGIFKELGADKEMLVTATGCYGSGFHDINNMLSARIRVRLPVGAGVEEQQTFPAVSKPVALRTHSFGDADAGDCELLEQVRDQLLRVVKIPVLKDELHCVPGQASTGVQTLQVKALLAAPATASP